MSVFYRQLDPRWANELLGYNTEKPYTLGNFGCLVTAWGNMLWKISGDPRYTPEFMNNWIKNHQGFLPGGGTMIWSVPLGLGFVESKGTLGNLADVEKWLADGPNYALIEVRTRSGNQHFVTGLTSTQVIDSADGIVKPITTYTFVNAHIYRASGGMGSAVPAPVTEQEPIMTAAEENEAYQTVLGRAPEGVVPSGRTAMQFIRDASGELADLRHRVAAQLAAATLQSQELQTKLDELTKQAPEAASVPTAAPLFPERVQEVVRTAIAPGSMVDYSGEGKPDLAVNAGMVFHQYSTFVAPDGRVKVRTKKSQENGWWYGTDESLFDPLPVPAPEVTPVDTVHLGAAKLFGKIGRWVYSLIKHK